MSDTEQFCEVCPEDKHAVILASHDLKPETRTWLCIDCWNEHKELTTVIKWAPAMLEQSVYFKTSF